MEININCDLGEKSKHHSNKYDPDLLEIVNSANVACGFDVLGFCLDGIGDEMIIRKSKDKGVRITVSDGYDLPLDIDKNIAGVSAKALYEKANPDFGFELEIYKRIKPGSGIGSSAASAVGSVFGMNQLLGKPFNQNVLTIIMNHMSIQKNGAVLQTALSLINKLSK